MRPVRLWSLATLWVLGAAVLWSELRKSYKLLWSLYLVATIAKALVKQLCQFCETPRTLLYTCDGNRIPTVEVQHLNTNIWAPTWEYQQLTTNSWTPKSECPDVHLGNNIWSPIFSTNIWTPESRYQHLNTNTRAPTCECQHLNTKIWAPASRMSTIG